MQYMSFDVSWFTTLPGIMVTVGLVLLIVGLIFYILSGKKDKTDVNDDQVANVSNGDSVPNVTEQVDAQPKEQFDNQMNNNPVLQSENVADSTTNNTETPLVTNDVVVPAVESPFQEVSPVESPVQNNPVAMENVSEPAVAEEVKVSPVDNVAVPSMAPVAPIEPVQTMEPVLPTVPVVDSPVVDSEVANPTMPVVDSPVVNPTVVEESKPEVSIYGGANPQVSFPTEEPRKAYGGADPLENTRTIPLVQQPQVPVTSVEPVQTVEPVQQSVPAVEVPNLNVNDNSPTAVTVTEVPKQTEKIMTTATPTDNIETLEF